MRLHDLSAEALGLAYRGGALAPTAVLEAVLARIALQEPRIHALCLLQEGVARKMAAASDARWRSGAPLSALDGVPVTIKENVATRGHENALGTRALEGLAPAEDDAPPAARLREAGCVILGKTTMPDFGMLSSGRSSLHGITRNPWNLERNPGGSSSGAAAGLAAGYGPLALGTDIGGSVRLPAAHCGLVALKPSLGRVPIHPPYLGRVAGPMARTVTDAALMLDVLARPDPRDPTSLPPAAADFASGLEDAGVAGLRIGLLLDIGVGLAPRPAILAAVRRAAALFGDAGTRVEPVAPFVTRAMADGLDRFFRARSRSELERLPAERAALVLPFIRDWAAPAAGWSAVDAMRALEMVFALREATVQATQAFDIVLSPTSPVPAYEAELPCPGGDPARPFEHIAFTAPFNFSEQPALSLPCGVMPEGDAEAGLPIGLQIVGRRFDDAGVLRAARFYERRRAPMPPWPEP